MKTEEISTLKTPPSDNRPVIGPLLPMLVGIGVPFALAFFTAKLWEFDPQSQEARVFVNAVVVGSIILFVTIVWLFRSKYRIVDKLPRGYPGDFD